MISESAYQNKFSLSPSYFKLYDGYFKLMMSHIGYYLITVISQILTNFFLIFGKTSIISESAKLINFSSIE